MNWNTDARKNEKKVKFHIPGLKSSFEFKILSAAAYKLYYNPILTVNPSRPMLGQGWM